MPDVRNQGAFTRSLAGLQRRGSEPGAASAKGDDGFVVVGAGLDDADELHRDEPDACRVGYIAAPLLQRKADCQSAAD